MSGILFGRLEPLFMKKLWNVSAIVLLSVVSSLMISETFRNDFHMF